MQLQMQHTIGPQVNQVEPQTPRLTLRAHDAMVVGRVGRVGRLTQLTSRASLRVSLRGTSRSISSGSGKTSPSLAQMLQAQALAQVPESPQFAWSPYFETHTHTTPRSS